MTPGDDLGRFRYLELCNIHVVLAVGLELNFRKSPNPPLFSGVRGLSRRAPRKLGTYVVRRQEDAEYRSSVAELGMECR